MSAQEFLTPEDILSTEKIFSCFTCQKVFSSSSNLNLHLKIHLDEKSYICSMCDRAFVRKSSLLRHQELHTREQPIFKCDDCGQDFSDKDKLRQHLDLHRNEMDIVPLAEESVALENPEKKNICVCSTCGRQFSTYSNLKMHLKNHSDEKEFACSICSKPFGRKSSLKRHLLTHNKEQSSFKCDECSQVFVRKDNLQQHLRFHQNSRFSCRECEKEFGRKSDLKQHVRVFHPRASIVSVKRKMPSSNTESKRLNKQRDALNVFRTLMFYPSENKESDLVVFQTHFRSELEENLLHEIHEKSSIKWYLVMKISLERITADEEIEEIQCFFRCQCFTEFTEDNIQVHLSEGFSKINKSFEEFIQRGSGWILKKIHYLELKIAKHHPLAASSFIPLPKKLTDKKALLNIKNEDNKCLVWCLLAHKLNLDREEHPHRVAHYIPYEKDIILGNVECPIPLQKMCVIEELNNLRINVFGYEDDEVCPLYISSKKDRDVINLLLIGDGEKQHYCLIRNFSRLLSDLTNHKAAAYYCYRCLHRFSKADLLENHIQFCSEHAAQAIKMPTEKDNILKFTGIHLQHPVAYTIYADFESLLIPISSVAPSSKASYTEKTTYHFPCGYSYVVIGPDGKCVKPAQVYRGKDCVEHFLEQMMIEKEVLGEKLLNIKPMKLSSKEEKAFEEAISCSICKQPLDERRVKDHDHLSGSFRGAAHPSCNLNFKQSKSIPVIFHNLKNYDGHHLMTKLGKIKDHEIHVIASSMENYITFKLIRRQSPIQMVFLDSFQFLPTSLEKLVKNLESNQFNILNEHFAKSSEISLLTRKGVYPYDYFTSFNKFDESQLPPPSAFFNSLTNEPVTEEDYEHALNIWKTFNIKTLGEFHDIYVKTDVLLLADVFQNFRTLCQQYYNIDSAHLFTAPSLAWQACLKMSETSLELLTDIDMLLMIENGIRGGISMISKRYAKANIPNTLNFNDKESPSYIMYWDSNNLYGWAMSQFLPCGGFEWYPSDKISEDWVLSLPDESETGFIFEVDLEYPKQLHELHNEYPVAPEKFAVTEDVLSPYARSLLNNRKFVGCEKLVPNLKNKEKYIVHYRNLKFYLQLGLKIITVRRALKFNQAPWLEKYIQFNTQKRKEAKSSFEKDFFKLMNNSVFGKTMENLRKRRNIVLCNTEKRAKKLVASPTFKAFKTFEEDLTAVERLKTFILMNRPIYVGFSSLELSKLLMYDFHYNFIKKAYKKNATLLFTDTDSLTYHITTNDIYKDMKQYSEYFDFSDYPKDHPLFSETNKKVIGKFKDELNGEIALEFVGLKSKMYSLKSMKSEKKRAKGVSTQVVRYKIKHQDYLDCLKKQKTSLEKQRRITQEGHKLYTLTQNKISLSPFDDKRFLIDNVNSLAYGHYKINQDFNEEEEEDMYQ